MIDVFCVAVAAAATVVVVVHLRELIFQFCLNNVFDSQTEKGTLRNYAAGCY